MKKLIAMLLALVMVLGLVACGGNTAPAATEAPKAEAPATEAPTETDAPKGGCKSSVMGVASLLVAMAAAVAMKKKDE